MTAAGSAVAVLGAGIMGASTALHLARYGVDVTVFEQATAPFTGASRWNEGKIHLGYLYAGDPTLRTARAVLPGGLDFARQVRRLTGLDVGSVTTSRDDLYLVHRDSVVSPVAAASYFAEVTALVQAQPGASAYHGDAARPTERLSADELRAVSGSGAVVAGFRVPERSVRTGAVADAFVAALSTEPRIELALGERVLDVSTRSSDRTGPWLVHTASGRHGPFAAVVNALWESRPGLDDLVGLPPDAEPHHRFRVSLFGRTRNVVDVPSAVLCVGGFGDVKNYDGRHFYLSWYPAGLLAQSDTLRPPTTPALTDVNRERIVAATLQGLAGSLPWVQDLVAACDDLRVEGGWVYSQGGGSIDDAVSPVHRRDRLGIAQHGSYWSVDTGKYSVAPTLGGELARRVQAALPARHASRRSCG